MEVRHNRVTLLMETSRGLATATVIGSAVINVNTGAMVRYTVDRALDARSQGYIKFGELKVKFNKHRYPLWALVPKSAAVLRKVAHRVNHSSNWHATYASLRSTKPPAKRGI